MALSCRVHGAQSSALGGLVNEASALPPLKAKGNDREYVKIPSETETTIFCAYGFAGGV